jgi:hypothetical protein
MLTYHPEPSMAPGCYGSALTYREGSQECSSCPFAAQCQPLHEERLASLRERLGIKNVAPRKPMANRTHIEHLLSAAEMTLPKKVVDLITRIDKAGIKVTESLREGKNPFETTPRFMRVVCHVLLHLPGGINRRTLTTALARKLEWTEGTASAHAAQAAHALVALGAAEEIDGILKLKR